MRHPKRLYVTEKGLFDGDFIFYAYPDTCLKSIFYRKVRKEGAMFAIILLALCAAHVRPLRKTLLPLRSICACTLRSTRVSFFEKGKHWDIRFFILERRKSN